MVRNKVKFKCFLLLVLMLSAIIGAISSCYVCEFGLYENYMVYFHITGYEEPLSEDSLVQIQCEDWKEDLYYISVDESSVYEGCYTTYTGSDTPLNFINTPISELPYLAQILEGGKLIIEEDKGFSFTPDDITEVTKAGDSYRSYKVVIDCAGGSN